MARNWIEFDRWFRRKSAAHKREYAVQQPEAEGWGGAAWSAAALGATGD